MTTTETYRTDIVMISDEEYRGFPSRDMRIKSVDSRAITVTASLLAIPDLLPTPLAYEVMGILFQCRTVTSTVSEIVSYE